MNKIKVLHISQSTDGIQRHVIGIVSKMDRNRFDVVGACPHRDTTKGASHDEKSFLEAFKKAGVRAYPIKMRREIRPVSDLISFFKIYNLIRKEKFDVVHAHSSKAGFLARIAARLAGTPVIVYTPNNFAFDRPARMKFQRFFYAALERFAGRFCDRVFAVCQDEKALAVNLKVLPPEKITVISNTIDVSGLNFGVDVAKKKRELGIKEPERLVVSVARTAPQKSPVDFVLAAEKILEKRKDVKFLFLGDGPLLKKTQKLIRKKGLSEHVMMPGWLNDTAEIIAACDIFVLSSLWEVLPNHSLLDALALSKPAVITATSGARETVTEGLNGYVVPPANPKALADGILKLLNLSLTELKKWGRHSREIFDRRLKTEDVTEIIQSTYVEILRKKGRGI